VKASVDKDLCTGCALCEDLAPEVFELEDDLAVVKVNPVPAEHEEAAKDAADQCPVEAITVE
jgi:ferredoxin